MNNIWVTTDWHLYSNKTNQRHPFRSDQSIESLTNAFLTMIHPDDLLIHLGDLCDPEVADEKEMRKIISSIPCYKILCKGNHDTETDFYYLNLGFDEVVDVLTIHNMVFSHKPVMIAPDEINIHGHLHTEKMVTASYQYINAYAANWDKEDQPILLDDILDGASRQNLDLSKSDEDHIKKHFEKYTSLEDSIVYTKIRDMSDEFLLVPQDETADTIPKLELSAFDRTDEIERDTSWQFRNGLLDEILFDDTDSTRYWEADDAAFRKKAERGEANAKDSANIMIDESAYTFDGQELYYLSEELLTDHLYPVGKSLFCNIPSAALHTARSKINSVRWSNRYRNTEIDVNDVFPFTTHLYKIAPSDYEYHLRASSEVFGSYWSMDVIELQYLGDILIRSENEWEFCNESNSLTESAGHIKEYQRVDNIKPIDREKKTELSDKYGIRNVGNTHDVEDEEARFAKRKAKEKAEQKRIKTIKMARNKKKREDFIRKLKGGLPKLPGVKNEGSAVDTSDADYLDNWSAQDNMPERNVLWGDQKHVMDHPGKYRDATLDEQQRIHEMASAWDFATEHPIQLYNDPLDESTERRVMNDRVVLTKLASKEKLYPVYVLIMHTGSSPISHTVRAFTGATYTHASISFDSTLKNMYSFGAKSKDANPMNPFNVGFREEDITSEFFTTRTVPYAMYVVPCTKAELDAMKKRLQYFIENKTKFKFDFLGLVKNYFNIADSPENRYFCSRFVMNILNSGRAGDNLYAKEDSLIRPEDFTSTNFAHYVCGGIFAEYNKKEADRVTNRILRQEELRRRKELVVLENRIVQESVYDIEGNNPWAEQILQYQLTYISESAFDALVQYLQSYKVRFDSDGNIIVSRREYDQLNMHFRNSLRMIKMYEKAGNIEGVKDEVCKINYMIQLINKYYSRPNVTSPRSGSKDIRKDMLDLRSVMLNALHQHIRYITVREPRWNFQSYYDGSKYGNDTKIPAKVLSTIGKTIVTALV